MTTQSFHDTVAEIKEILGEPLTVELQKEIENTIQVDAPLLLTAETTDHIIRTAQPLQQ